MISAAPGSRESAPLEWETIVDAVRQGIDIRTLLSATFERGIRFLVRRKVRTEQIEAIVHDCLDSAVTAVQSAIEMTQPESLPQVIIQCVNTQIAAFERNGTQPLGLGADDGISGGVADFGWHLQTRRKWFQSSSSTLVGLSVQDREILTRFYVNGESREHVCEDLSISSEEFDACKARARSKWKGPTRKGPGRESNDGRRAAVA